MGAESPKFCSMARIPASLAATSNLFITPWQSPEQSSLPDITAPIASVTWVYMASAVGKTLVWQSLSEKPVQSVLPLSTPVEKG